MMLSKMELQRLVSAGFEQGPNSSTYLFHVTNRGVIVLCAYLERAIRTSRVCETSWASELATIMLRYIRGCDVHSYLCRRVCEVQLTTCFLGRQKVS
jgi:hypothetical protein